MRGRIWEEFNNGGERGLTVLVICMFVKAGWAWNCFFFFCGGKIFNRSRDYLCYNFFFFFCLVCGRTEVYQRRLGWGGGPIHPSSVH